MSTPLNNNNKNHRNHRKAPDGEQIPPISHLFPDNGEFFFMICLYHQVGLPLSKIDVARAMGTNRVTLNKLEKSAFRKLKQGFKQLGVDKSSGEGV